MIGDKDFYNLFIMEHTCQVFYLNLHDVRPVGRKSLIVGHIVF